MRASLPSQRTLRMEQQDEAIPALSPRLFEWVPHCNPDVEKQETMPRDLGDVVCGRYPKQQQRWTPNQVRRSERLQMGRSINIWLPPDPALDRIAARPPDESSLRVGPQEADPS